MTKTAEQIELAASNFPISLDSDDNLYLVHDALRVKLAIDYVPGDKSITIYDEDGVLSKFPNSGIITLTEQCSDVKDRAISFYYDAVTTSGFSGLVLLIGFSDVVKPANITNVTLNVVNYHHEVIKNSVMSIQKFMGLKNEENSIPKNATNSTITARLNYLRKIVYTPRAWFISNKISGTIPSTVIFTDQSFGLGYGSVTYNWIISSNGIAVNGVGGILTTEKTYTYTFTSGGIYDVSLKVTNEFGSDTVSFEKMIIIRTVAPDEAILEWIPTIGQIVDGQTIRAPTDSFVFVEVIDNGEQPSDPIVTYTWSLSDDINHPSQPNAQGLYSVGGLYDLILRTDTTWGSYRITKHSSVINMVEAENLWLWVFPNMPLDEYNPLKYIGLNGNVTALEFGLLSETFKVATTTLTVDRSENFITAESQNGIENVPQAKTEFRRNVSFTPKGTVNSGHGGKSMLYWAGQDSSVVGPGTTYSDHAVINKQHDGFTDTYINYNTIARPWNWVCLNSDTTSYFLLGVDYMCGSSSTESPTYQVVSELNLVSLAVTSANLSFENYTNGSYELQQNPANYNGSGDITSGNFSVTRTAWKGNSGYILRNSAAGTFFRIKNFYRTEGTLGQEFQTISKLIDMTGPAKLEGQLVTLSDGLFFFNNSGNISAYNDITGVWETGGAGAGSSSFRSMQDTTESDFDDPMNTLLAASYDRTAYLSFDYSPYAFVKFNSLDLAFYNLGAKPIGKSQFLMGVY
jgi:PKD repeat protein